MPKAERVHSTPPKTASKKKAEQSAHKRHPDAKIIASCVEYVRGQAAFTAGFAADPTRGSDFAGLTNPEIDEAFDASNDQIAILAKLTSRTAEGIRGKARIVSHILAETNARLDVLPPEAEFLKKLAREIDQYLLATKPQSVVSA